MKKLLIASALFLCSCISVYAQTATPTPTPADDDVVKISVNLIQVDVTVTDSKGNPVTDLKPEDFEIYENGEKQNISNFSFISNVRTRIADPQPVKDKIDIPVPPTAVRREDVRRTIALVVDDLSLSFRSAYDVRRALRKYVDEQMQDGDLVAIIRTGSGTGALQQFTTDKQLLYAAIERVKWNPVGNGGVSAFAPITDYDEVPDNQSPNEEDENYAVDYSLDDFRESYFATGTLGALRYIVRGMGELPGRKSVVLFSDGFRMCQTDNRGFVDCERVYDFVRQVVDAANRASVVFYTIDARGLQTLGITAEDSVNNASPQRIAQIQADRRAQLIETQQGLAYIAQETGGISIANTNDLSRGVQRVVDDQSYYLLAYIPDGETFDAAKRRFNKLEVKVKRSGVNVRHRSGFFNVATVEKPKETPAATAGAKLQEALFSPFAVNGISLRLNTLFASDAKMGSYVRSLLYVRAEDLTFTDEPNGSKKAVFDILAASFGESGQPVDQLAKTYTLRTTAEGLEQLKKNGFVYHFTFPVKKPGPYQFRVAIRDRSSDKVGSASQFISIPDLKKERLTISGIVLENLTLANWQQANDPSAKSPETDPMTDTSVRRFARGTILRYGFEIYNAKLDESKRPNLTTQMRVYRDRKLILDGKATPLDAVGQKDLSGIKSAGAISLAGKIAPGDYVLQIIVFDNLAREKRRVATQFVQFEVTE